MPCMTSLFMPYMASHTSQKNERMTNKTSVVHALHGSPVRALHGSTYFTKDEMRKKVHVVQIGHDCVAGYRLKRRNSLQHFMQK